MIRNLLVTGVAALVMGLFALLYRQLAPARQTGPMQYRSLAAAGTASGFSSAQAMPSQQGVMLFRQQIRPMLVTVCLKCHDSVKRSGGLDLSRRDTALGGGQTGEAIVPGHPEESLAVQLVTAGEMPKDAPLLTAGQITALKEWIRLGAPYEAEPLAYAPGGDSVSPGPAAMGTATQSSPIMGGGSSSMNNMMMCPCMQMMMQTMGRGASAGIGPPQPSSSNTAAGGPTFNPRTEEQARRRAEEHLERLGNPNLKIGEVNHTVASFEVQVVTQDGSLVNWLIIDKQSGRIRTLY
ncbi:MAG TPA: hypothetical protein EYP56_03115 [Planctomycetaceae bacterium]|nr:hypothetical protein [Planctomycetaceae bacterium]